MIYLDRHGSGQITALKKISSRSNSPDHPYIAPPHPSPPHHPSHPPPKCLPRLLSSSSSFLSSPSPLHPRHHRSTPFPQAVQHINSPAPHCPHPSAAATRTPASTLSSASWTRCNRPRVGASSSRRTPRTRLGQSMWYRSAFRARFRGWTTVPVVATMRHH